MSINRLTALQKLREMYCLIISRKSLRMPGKGGEMKQGRKKQLLSVLLSFIIVLEFAIALIPAVKARAAVDTDFTDLITSCQTVRISGVSYNGNTVDWYVIGFNSEKRTVTLLPKQFLGNQSFSDTNNSNYSESSIKIYVEGLIGEGKSLYSIKDSLANISVTDPEVTGAVPYLLNVNEVEGLNETATVGQDFHGNYGIWWLRSSAGEQYDDGKQIYYMAAYYSDINGVPNGSIGEDVRVILGVRPAIQLDLSKVIFSSETMTFTPHTHSFTYSADGDTITATCGESVCSLSDNKAAITITAPTLTTYGLTGDDISPKAALAGLSDFNIATKLNVSEENIAYYGANKNGTTYSKNGNALSAAPSNAGEYIAEITVQGETASLGYTISKAVPTVSAPSANTLTYSGKAQDLIKAGSTKDGTMQYALGTDADTEPTDGWNTSIPTGVESGTYHVWYRVVGDSNHNDTVPVCLTVVIGEKKDSPAEEEVISENTERDIISVNGISMNKVTIGSKYEVAYPSRLPYSYSKGKPMDFYRSYRMTVSYNQIEYAVTKGKLVVVKIKDGDGTFTLDYYLQITGISPLKRRRIRTNLTREEQKEVRALTRELKAKTKVDKKAARTGLGKSETGLHVAVYPYTLSEENVTNIDNGLKDLVLSGESGNYQFKYTFDRTNNKGRVKNGKKDAQKDPAVVTYDKDTGLITVSSCEIRGSIALSSNQVSNKTEDIRKW